MILIRDYRNPPCPGGRDTVQFGLSPGQTARVHTTGHVFFGLVVREDADTLTLAVSVPRRKSPDCLVIAKAHIIAVER